MSKSSALGREIAKGVVMATVGIIIGMGGGKLLGEAIRPLAAWPAALVVAGTLVALLMAGVVLPLVIYVRKRAAQAS